MADIKLKMKMDASEVKKGVNEAKSTIGSMGQQINSSLVSQIGKFAGVGAALAGAYQVAKFAVEKFNQAIQDGADIADKAKRLDMTPEKLQSYSYAAKKGASDIDTLASTIEKLQRQLVDAGKDTNLEGALLRLGVSVEAIRTKNAERALSDIGRALESSAPSAQRTADLFEVLGKSSGGLIVTLKELRSNINRSSQGFIVSDKDIKSLKEASELVEDFGLKFKTGTMQIAAGIIKLGNSLVQSERDFMGFLARLDAKANVPSILQINEMSKAGYAGGYADEARIKEMQEAYDNKRLAKENAIALAELKKSEQAKKDLAAQIELEKEEQKEKEKVSVEIQKIQEANKLIGISDEERLKLLEAQQSALEKQLELVKNVPVNERSLADTEAMKQLEQLKGEKSRLQLQMAKDFANKNKLDITSDSAVGIGNLLGSNLSSKMLSIGEETNRLLKTIANNTRSRFDQPASIFTS